MCQLQLTGKINPWEAIVDNLESIETMQILGNTVRVNIRFIFPDPKL